MPTRRTFLSWSVAAAAVTATATGCSKADPTPQGPSPSHAEVSVHDPDLILVDGTFHIFGSHLASARSSDLMSWTQDTTEVSSDNPLFDDVRAELAETFEWAQSQTLWAPDITRLPDGTFAYYYCACRGDSPLSALGLATASSVTGPYRDQGILLKSGMTDQNSPDGTPYDAKVHPNTIDADVFTDTDGGWWMVYGSFSGGIFLLALDPATGKPQPNQGYGKHLGGGNHARIEGAAVVHHPDSGSYYLMLTFGGLDAVGGYNVRVFRSQRPDGPYLDPAGRDFAQVKADPSKPLFDDVTIAPFGGKLFGNHQWVKADAESGTAEGGVGMVSPGGVSPWHDPETGRLLVVLHTRMPGLDESHEVRVHQMYLNAEGWPVAAPFRYAGESLAEVPRSQRAGDYELIEHQMAITPDLATPRQITLDDDGTIAGAVTGTWSGDHPNHTTLVINDLTHHGVFSTQWHPDRQRWVTCFSGLSAQGTSVWGVRTS